MRRIIICFLLLLPFCLYADSHHQDPTEFKITKIRSDFFLLQGKGGNVLVNRGRDGLLMIDNDYREMSAPLEEALAALGGRDQVRYLLNTHWHGDHTGNNRDFGGITQIVAHENVRRRLSRSQRVKLFNMKTKPEPESALPNITYTRKMTLYFNDQAVELRHFPRSHTDSDSAVFFTDKNIVHTGDLYFQGMFPFVDVDNAGDVVNVARSVKSILDDIRSSTKVIPGHGALSNKRELRQYYDMLVGTTAEVRAMITEGLSKKKAQARGLSDKWESWGNGFISEEVWIGLVYESLS